MKNIFEGPLNDPRGSGGAPPKDGKELELNQEQGLENKVLISGNSYSPHEVPPDVTLDDLTGEIKLDKEQYENYFSIAENILRKKHERFVIEQYTDTELFYIGIMMDILENRSSMLSQVIHTERKQRMAAEDLKIAQSIDDVIALMKSYALVTEDAILQLEKEKESANPEDYPDYLGIREALVRLTK